MHTFTCTPQAPARGGPGRWGAPPTPSSKGPTPKLPRTESLFFCEKCQTPCNSFDELQVHMLTNHFDESPTTAAAAQAADAAAPAADAADAVAPAAAVTPASSASSTATAAVSAPTPVAAASTAAATTDAMQASELASNLSSVLASMLNAAQPPPPANQ